MCDVKYLCLCLGAAGLNTITSSENLALGAEAQHLSPMLSYMEQMAGRSQEFMFTQLCEGSLTRQEEVSCAHST